MVTKKELYHRILELELDVSDLIIRLEKLETKTKTSKKSTKTVKPIKEPKLTKSKK